MSLNGWTQIRCGIGHSENFVGKSNQVAVSALSLEQALSAAEQNSGLSPNPVDVYQRLVDTYASAPNARIADARWSRDLVFKVEYSLNRGQELGGKPRDHEDLVAAEVALRF